MNPYGLWWKEDEMFVCAHCGPDERFLAKPQTLSSLILQWYISLLCFNVADIKKQTNLHWHNEVVTNHCGSLLVSAKYTNNIPQAEVGKFSNILQIEFLRQNTCWFYLICILQFRDHESTIRFLSVSLVAFGDASKLWHAFESNKEIRQLSRHS